MMRIGAIRNAKTDALTAMAPIRQARGVRESDAHDHERSLRA